MIFFITYDMMNNTINELIMNHMNDEKHIFAQPFN
jgi:hypothetical protein